jgi:Uma2 family endonuclease
MFAVVTPEQVKLSPGTIVRLPGSWADYRAIVAQLGDRQTPRIKYRHGEILLMSPLPIHGRQADGIANVVKVLLEHFQLDYTSFTPIIMELSLITVSTLITGRRSQVKIGLFGELIRHRI